MKKFNFNFLQFLIFVVCFVFVFTSCSTLDKVTTVDFFSCFETDSYLYGTVDVKDNFEFVKTTLSDNFALPDKVVSKILPRCNNIYFSLYSSSNSTKFNKQNFQGIITGNFPVKIFNNSLKKVNSIKQVTQGSFKYFQYEDLNIFLVNKNILLISTGDMLSFYDNFNKNLFTKNSSIAKSFLEDLNLLNSTNCVLYSNKVGDLLKQIPNNKITFPIEQLALSFETKEFNGDLFFELKDSKFQRVATALFRVILPENIVKFIDDTTVYIPNIKLNLEKSEN